MSLHSISKGTIGELKAKAKFLEHGISVYEDEVDIRGTDFIALPYEEDPTPLKIQVKATDSHDKSFRINEDTSADYYFFIYTDTEDFWIIPKSEESKILSEAENPDNIGSRMFDLNPGKWEDYEGFQAMDDLVDIPDFHASRRGRAGENYAIAYLLESGIDISEPLTDTKGIDAIIRADNRYFDLQIKYASTDENGISFRNVSKRDPSSNYLFLFVVGEPRQYYLMPSSRVEKKANDNGGIYLNQELREEFEGLSYLENEV